MQTDDRASERSSSPISSAPQSPHNHHHNGASDTIHVARHSHTNPGFANGDGVVRPLSANPAAPHTAHQSHVTSKSATASAPEKPKRPRKKKDDGPDGKPVADDKEKKPRKPRAPKDPNKPTAPRKRQKTGEATETITQSTPVSSAAAPSRQPTIADMMAIQPPPSSAGNGPPFHPHHPSSEHMIRSSVPPHLSNPVTSRPSSSGQNYDPIRGSTVETSRPPPPTVPSTAPPSAHTSPYVNRASASPSIASLVHPPPTATKTSAPPGYPQQALPQPSMVPSQQQSPPPKTTTPAFAPPPPQQSPPPSRPTPSNLDGAMDVDVPQCDNPLPKPAEVKKAPSKSSSSAPTPKETSKAPTVPKASGTGLLSGSSLFGGPASGDAPERKNVDIEITIPLNPKGGNTVNIAQEIVRKYGQDAINPRAAAHRAQLLRLAAQQSRLEGNTTDDMSVDLMSDVDGESNVEMGGVDSGDGAEKPKKKRRTKQEEYDKEDDFIDDTELAWQEQAAVAKDGFFVYSGPLVPEGQDAKVEASGPTRGGRGRGRGRARAGAAAAATAASSGTTHANLADKKAEAAAATPSTRGGKGSRGGRGSGVTRKPRMTKADRERMEADKAGRERAAGLLAHGGAHVSLGPTSTPGPTVTGAGAVGATTTTTTTTTTPSMQQTQGYPQMAGHAAAT